MPDSVHLVRLEVPADALRTSCGALRCDRKWTTVREQVTCPRCLRAAGEQQVRRAGGGAGEPDAGGGPGPRAGR